MYVTYNHIMLRTWILWTLKSLLLIIERNKIYTIAPVSLRTHLDIWSFMNVYTYTDYKISHVRCNFTQLQLDNSIYFMFKKNGLNKSRYFIVIWLSMCFKHTVLFHCPMICYYGDSRNPTISNVTMLLSYFWKERLHEYK